METGDLTEEALGAGRMVLVKNIEDEPHYKGKVTSISLENRRPKSYIAIPISIAGCDFRVLAVDCYNTNDGDIKAYAIVSCLVVEMFAEIIRKSKINEFDLYNSA